MPRTVVTSILWSILLPRAAEPGLFDEVLDGERVILVDVVDVMVAET